MIYDTVVKLNENNKFSILGSIKSFDNKKFKYILILVNYFHDQENILLFNFFLLAKRLPQTIISFLLYNFYFNLWTLNILIFKIHIR